MLTGPRHGMRHTGCKVAMYISMARLISARESAKKEWLLRQILPDQHACGSDTAVLENGLGDDGSGVAVQAL